MKTNPICLALDVPTANEAIDLVNLTQDFVGTFKVGLELLSTSDGHVLIRKLVRSNKRVFVDLKLHDIPNTMARATKRVVDTGANFLTIHTAAGREAMEACAQEVLGTQLRLLAVSVLTSISVDNASDVFGDHVRGQDDLADLVDHRASVALKAGVTGLVCSAYEVPFIRRKGDPRSFLVTPGIRPRGDDVDDQKRVVTPAEAIEAGSDMLVIGRPIRAAKNPRTAARAIYDSVLPLLEN